MSREVQVRFCESVGVRFPRATHLSFMSEQVPSFYFQVGVRNEARGITAGTHTEAFDIDESALPEGARLLARLAEAALK